MLTEIFRYNKEKEREQRNYVARSAIISKNNACTGQDSSRKSKIPDFEKIDM